MMLKKLDCTENLKYINNKFRALNKEITIKYNHQMYKPIPKAENEQFFRDDWTTLAFRSFKQIKLKNKINDICLLGTGTGLDALGAIEIFNPKTIVLTDVQKQILILAEKNVKENLQDGKSYELNCIPSYFFNNISKEKRFDLIYENLPNLPEKFTTESEVQPSSASFSPKFGRKILNDIKNIPDVYKNYLLTTHYLALKQAKDYLAKDGVIICSIGGRFDYKIIEKMFESLGYQPEIILYDVKAQNESDTNLPAYSKCEKTLKEKHNNKTFTFYDYNNVMKYLEKNKGYRKYSGWLQQIEYIKKHLKTNKLTAEEANKEFMKGKNIAHEVYFIAGRLRQ